MYTSTSIDKLTYVLIRGPPWTRARAVTALKQLAFDLVVWSGVISLRDGQVQWLLLLGVAVPKDNSPTQKNQYYYAHNHGVMSPK